MGLDVLEYLGELGYLEEKGDPLIELEYPPMNVGNTAEGLKQFSTSGIDSASSSHIFEAI